MGVASDGYGLARVSTGAKFEDSNMAKYGDSDMKKQMHDKAALEAAFYGAGQKPGIEIWRAEDIRHGKFGVNRWPTSKGFFYNGDSYITLETQKQGSKLVYDIFYWCGSKTSMDEAGVVAYKTVELDDLLDGLPVQHRETEGSETKRFKALFGGRLMIKEGGIDSGFTHVKLGGKMGVRPSQLFLVKGRIARDQFIFIELPLDARYINDDDVFVLSYGLGGRDPNYIQYNGSRSSGQERMLGEQLISLGRASPGNGMSRRRVVDGGDDATFFGKLQGGYADKGQCSFGLGGDSALYRRLQQLKFCNIWQLKKNALRDFNLDFADTPLVHVGPFDRSKLRSDGIFIIGVIPHALAIWFGKDVTRAAFGPTMVLVEKWMRSMKIGAMSGVRIIEGDAKSEAELMQMFGGR